MNSDPLPIGTSIILIIVLIFLNAFFVAAEFAMVKVRNSRIDALVQNGSRTAKYAQTIVNNLNAYLSACQLGITLTSLVLGWLGEPTVARILDPLLKGIGLNDVALHTISFLVSFSVITFLHITLGEQFPKTYAIRKSENVTLWISVPIIAFYKVMYPFNWILNSASNGLLRMSGIEPADEHESAHTEEEIRVLMKESNKSGLIDNTELALVDNIFEFAETTAREIMIPRTEMVCLYTNLSYEENREIAVVEMHTRYPVCETDKDNIVGFLHIKDLLRSSELEDISSIVRPLTSIPESMQISQLLKLMQKQKTQMALLIDEYGGTSGLVTLEDIMEEIVGEIQDEFDEERPSIEKQDDSTFSIDGMMLIDSVNDYFGLEIENDDYDTIGGWVYSQVEIPPQKGQTIKYDAQYAFRIEETDHLRISRIVVKISEPREADLEDLMEEVG